MRKLFVQLLRLRTLRKIIISLLFISISLAIMIVPIESGKPGASIHNLEDSVWWTITTITAVGYGDVVPVTLEGRALGVVLQIIGVILSSSIVGSIIVELHRKKDDYEWDRISKKLDQISGEIEETKKKTDFLILQTGEKKKKS